jgi:pilus assembly protein FimV
VSDPFIDLLLEATWNTGRIVRDYTVLLDPPASRSTATAVAPVPVSPQISIGTGPASIPPPSARRPARPAIAAAPTPAEAPTVRTTEGSGAGQQVTVQPGDTASKIAGAYKPADVSLDQMLVAMLRANPNAFIGGNMNRMKAGAVLDLPDASQAAATPAPEARRTVVAQSRDFGDYRRRLAENAPASAVAPADRQSSGRLEANVEDRSKVAAAPDKLTIAQARAAEDKLAQTRQAQESSARVAELSKNISDLNKLQSAGATASASAGATPAAPASASAPVAPAAAPATTTPTAAAPTAPAASSAAPTVVAPAAATAALTPPPSAAARMPVTASSWKAACPRTPSSPPAAGSRSTPRTARSSRRWSIRPASSMRRRRRPGRRSRRVPGLRPRPAGRGDPQGSAAHQPAANRHPPKLLEIYAKRRDLRAYEALASDVHKLTGGQGNDWNRVVEMGKELDPGNPLYEAGVRPVGGDSVLPATAAIAATAVSAVVAAPPAAPVAAPPPAFVPSVAPLDFDLDLSRPSPLDTTTPLPAPITEPAPVSASLPPIQTPVPERFAATSRDTLRDIAPMSPQADFDTDFNTAPAALEMPGMSRSMRTALGVSYNGQAYDGWQSQPSGRTVQDQLEGGPGPLRRPARLHPLRRPHRCRRARPDAGGALRHRHAREPFSWVRGTNTSCRPTSRCSGPSRCPTASTRAPAPSARRYAYVLLESPVRPSVEAGRVGWVFRRSTRPPCASRGGPPDRRARLHVVPRLRLPGASRR